MGNNKIKIFVLGSDRLGWSIDKDRKAVIRFLEANNFQITKNIFGAKIIFCVWYSLLRSNPYGLVRFVRKIFGQKIITVATNDVIFYKDRVDAIKYFVDIWIAPSKRVYDFLIDQGLKAYHIPFFVDPEIFKKLNLSKKEICEKLNIDYDKIENRIVVGSFQRDSLGKDLSKPKWHKNPDLLVNILDKLPKDKFILLLGGPRRHYVIKKCLEKNIDFLFYGDYSYIEKNKDDVRENNLPLEVVNKLYNLTDIYLVTSASEGGPKQVIESAFTKTMIFSTKVGLAPDILHLDVLFDDKQANEIAEKIKIFSESPEKFQKYIDYNFASANKNSGTDILKEKYKNLISYVNS